MGVQKAKNTESTLKVANASMNYPHAFSAAFTVFFFSKRPSVTVQTSQAHCLSWSPSFSQMETEAGTFTQLQNVEVGKNKTKDNVSITRQIFQRKKRLMLLLAMDITKKHEKKTVQSSVLPQKKLPSLPSVQFWQQGFWTMVQAALSKVNPVLREDWTS